jgi:hypothetical protein
MGGGQCAECQKKQVNGKPLQTKLAISEPDDAYEQEADRMAEHVMRMPAADVSKKLNKDMTHPLVQRQVNGGVSGLGEAPPIVHEVLNSSGQPLDMATRAFFEPRFGHDLSRVRIHTGARAGKVPSAPVNKFEDCPVDWQRRANSALVVARKWVANVATGLANLPFPFPAPVATLLNRHFHIADRGYVAEVRRYFNTINSALNSPIDFECEKNCDDNVAAYVYSIWSDVHLCPVWYSLSTSAQANTIIHEIAHDAADRDDKAYIWQAAYNKLSVKEAVDNADSYSNFAEEAYGP